MIYVPISEKSEDFRKQLGALFRYATEGEMRRHLKSLGFDPTYKTLMENHFVLLYIITPLLILGFKDPPFIILVGSSVSIIALCASSNGDGEKVRKNIRCNLLSPARLWGLTLPVVVALLGTLLLGVITQIYYGVIVVGVLNLIIALLIYFDFSIY